MTSAQCDVAAFSSKFSLRALPLAGVDRPPTLFVGFDASSSADGLPSFTEPSPSGLDVVVETFVVVEFEGDDPDEANKEIHSVLHVEHVQERALTRRHVQ